MIIEEDDLVHYGVLRRSGRYPWGSSGWGKGPQVTDENQRNKVFVDFVRDLKKQGLSEKQVANGFGISIKELRAANSIALNAQKQSDINMAQRLKDKGYSNTAIADRVGASEAKVRTLLAPGAKDKKDIIQTTSDKLRGEVDKKRYIDVGSGVENHVGVTSTTLSTAVSALQQEGYVLHRIKIPQVTNSRQFTNAKVLGAPGTTQREIFLDPSKIKHIGVFSDDNGRNFYGLHPPIKVDPKRIDVVFAEDGGDKADGVVYVRPGVKDVELGGSKYAQVRIAVGDNHFIKGMALYKDDLPAGVDLQFNTSASKKDKKTKLDAFKLNKDDPDNPFGSMISRQIVENPGTKEERVTSAMNVVYEQGKWDTWSRNLSSQMLSKQSPALAKSQLDMTFERRQNDFEAIKNLTNPTVRKKLLEEFAETTASASVHLKAASLPRQTVRVILPISNIKPTEVYAPGLINGERVVLIRHPHGGTFEIPELTVNNHIAEGKKLLGDSRDAIGIHHSVAQHLSGADFDGDTVLAIPNNTGKVKVDHALDALKNFDPRASYPYYDGMKVMSNTQAEMGIISNLITDMSLRKAPVSDIAKAVKHSMVVIDAEKHKLDYKQSFNDNEIKRLKAKYQTGGATTIISRARAREFVPQREPRPFREGGPVDRTTGALVFKETGAINFRTGKPKLTRTTKIAETSDARTLMSSASGTQMERLYADHSNRLKAMANAARLEALNTPPSKKSASAAKTYAPEVERLNAALDVAKRARPLERQAQLIAGARVRAKRDVNPTMDEDTLNKVKAQALDEARNRTGSKKTKIKISDKEWEAIQHGAVSNSKLTEILNEADMEVVRDHATPKSDLLMTPTKTARAKAMLASGYDRAEVARQLGVSLSTLDRSMA